MEEEEHDKGAPLSNLMEISSVTDFLIDLKFGPLTVRYNFSLVYFSK